MELEDFRLLYNVWHIQKMLLDSGGNPPKDGISDFPDWLYANGYNVESVLQYEDEASQREWLKREVDEYLPIRKTNRRTEDGIRNHS